MLSNGRFELDPASEEEEGPMYGPLPPPWSLTCIAQITLAADALAEQQQQQLDVPIEEPIIPQLPVQQQHQLDVPIEEPIIPQLPVQQQQQLDVPIEEPIIPQLPVQQHTDGDHLIASARGLVDELLEVRAPSGVTIPRALIVLMRYY